MSSEEAEKKESVTVPIKIGKTVAKLHITVRSRCLKDLSPDDEAFSLISESTDVGSEDDDGGGDGVNEMTGNVNKDLEN